MAPVRTSRIDFPERKLRPRSSSRTAGKNVVDNKKDYHAIAGSPIKKQQPKSPLKSPKKSPPLSPLKSLVLTSPTKSPQKAAKKLATGENSDPNIIVKKQKSLQLHRELSVPKEWSEAKKSLALGHPTNGIVGRDKQTAKLKEFLELNLKKAKKSVKRSLYVSGPPGTGKTTLLKSLLKDLESSSSFCQVFVNCMSLKSTKAIFMKIAECLGCEGSKDPQAAITEYIVSSRVPILLVLDEIDQLESKAQQVLYTIYEWPYLEGSKARVIGIANALDLTDRVLPRLKLRESFCPEELTFPAYSRDEISKIISSRLEPIGIEIIKPAAVRFLAAKISALSGDVRKALDVCRRALELREVEIRKQTLLKPSSVIGSHSLKPIDIPVILKIVNDVYCNSAATSSLTTANSDLPLQQKIIVASLLLMTNYGVRPVKEVTVGKLHETYSRICKNRSMAAFCLTEVHSLCSMLESRGFFSTKSSKIAKDVKVSLRIDEDEVELALKDKTLLSGIIKDVDCIAR